MIDEFVEDIQRMRDDGAFVIIKWDGERSTLRQTIAVNRPDTDYVWRKDCDDLASTLRDAIVDYQRAHAR